MKAEEIKVNGVYSNGKGAVRSVNRITPPNGFVSQDVFYSGKDEFSNYSTGVISLPNFAKWAKALVENAPVASSAAPGETKEHEHE